ncbi:MAG: flagellar biosynthesis anti-sigma factor FlgM [Oligoflexia bacterium]|nr:flagellar biosynthesis anti-sigma factor FlgM [Oligoflexia bacterium]
MKVDRLSRLFETLNQTTKTIEPKITDSSVSQARSGDSQAVKLSPQLNEAAGEPRSEKLARISQQVRDGSYNPDLNKVAEAVARELL